MFAAHLESHSPRDAYMKWLIAFAVALSSNAAEASSTQDGDGCIACPKPSVSIRVTADHNLSRLRAARILAFVRAQIDSVDAWTLVGNGENLVADAFPPEGTRAALHDQARNSGSDFAARVVLSKQQASYGRPWLHAYAEVVEAVSGNYVVVADAAWFPDDTSAMHRGVQALLHRLVPLPNVPVCYFESLATETVRNGARDVVRAKGGVRVMGREQKPVAGASIFGHWAINGSSGPPRTGRSDQTGHLEVAFERPVDDPGAGVMSFAVDSISCPAARFVPDWPQREMDQALAILENARANLDENADHRGAMEGATRFLALDESNVAWYAALINPPNAPNRRQQAELILRRARATERYASTAANSTQPWTELDPWTVVLGFGSDLLPPDEGDAYAFPQSDVAGAPDTLHQDLRRWVTAAVGVRRHLARGVGIGAALSMARNEVTVPDSTARLVRDANITALTLTTWVAKPLTHAVTARGAIGIRFARRNVSGDGLYLLDGSLTGVPGSGPIVDDLDGASYTGMLANVGLSLRTGDFSPIWIEGDLSFLADRLPNGYWTTRIAMSAGLAVSF